MKVPPFLLGAGLLLWGWQVQQYWLAGGLAVALEAGRFLNWRFSLDHKDINRIVDLCGLALAGVVVYSLIIDPLTVFILSVLQWLPVVLFPLIALQSYSNYEQLPLTALSMQQRRWGKSMRTVDIGFAYFIVCVIAASTGNRMAEWFYLALVALWAWALWRQRNPRFASGVWLGLMLLAAGAGFFGYKGLGMLQQTLEEQAPLWLMEWLERRYDPYRRTTALGYIGRLKLSNRIVMRVTGAQGGAAPALLRTASYNAFSSGVWFGRSGDFEDIRRLSAMSWEIALPALSEQRVRITQYADTDVDMLSLPIGARRLEGFAADRIVHNALGAIKVFDVPAILDFDVAYSAAEDANPPTDDDRRVSLELQPSLAVISRDLKLTELAPVQIATTLKAYFQNQFSYSLDLDVMDQDVSPLLDFLINSRRGHCEYFASATVLLLRQAGIPARYASGYSVQEFSELENRYIVRRRHAHAWAVAWIDGRWRNVDTTPGVWVEDDARQSSIVTPLYDILSWLWLRFNEARMANPSGHYQGLLVLLLMPLIVILVWRLRNKQRVRYVNKRGRRAVQTGALGPGGDSECYRIVDWLSDQGLERTPGETLLQWFTRIEHTANAHGDARTLQEVLRLHYRYRFDPVGLDANERERLRLCVAAWLAGDSGR